MKSNYVSKRHAKIAVDQFLKDFANSVNDDESLEHVGNQLANLVNERIKVGEVRGGFHLAGYVQEAGKRFPALYHVHTGPEQKPPYQPLRLYRDYPFGNNFAVDEWLKELETKLFYLRNGLIDTYVHFHRYLHDLMRGLQEVTGFVCPDSSKFATALEARGRFLKLQIETICHFYRLSNCLETIAMPVSWITISPNKIEHFEPIVI